MLGLQLGDPADHVELALEGVLVGRLGPAGADEQLAEHGPAGGGDGAAVLL